jgi:hypothetical protein
LSKFLLATQAGALLLLFPTGGKELSHKKINKIKKKTAAFFTLRVLPQHFSWDGVLSPHLLFLKELLLKA